MKLVVVTLRPHQAGILHRSELDRYGYSTAWELPDGTIHHQPWDQGEPVVQKVVPETHPLATKGAR